MSVSIQIDAASLAHLNRQLAVLQQAGPRSLYSALFKIAYKIKVEAQLRLRGKKHIVTSRLRNSLFVKTKNKPTVAYQDKDGKPFISELASVAIADTELAIGTNVEYGGKIENMDSFLYWAVQNVDISKSVAEDVRQTLANAMRFGIGVLPQNRP